MELANKTCLIVGATGAIGHAVAESFHREGARVALTFHSQRKSALKTFSLTDPRVALFKLDVRNRKNVRAVVARVRQKLGPITALGNCSRVLGTIGRTHKVSAARW